MHGKERLQKKILFLLNITTWQPCKTLFSSETDRIIDKELQPGTWNLVRGQIISHIHVMYKLRFELLIRIMATMGKFKVTSNKFNTYSMFTYRLFSWCTYLIPADLDVWFMNLEMFAIWEQEDLSFHYCICTVHVRRSLNCQYQHMHNFVTG